MNVLIVFKFSSYCVPKVGDFLNCVDRFNKVYLNYDISIPSQNGFIWNKKCNYCCPKQQKKDVVMPLQNGFESGFYTFGCFFQLILVQATKKRLKTVSKRSRARALFLKPSYRFCPPIKYCMCDRDLIKQNKYSLRSSPIKRPNHIHMSKRIIIAL